VIVVYEQFFSDIMARTSYISRVLGVGCNLVISYYLCASEIWPDKKDDRFLLSLMRGAI
jgi:hypothetical protein